MQRNFWEIRINMEEQALQMEQIVQDLHRAYIRSLDIPRTSLEQSAYGTKVSASSIKQGDLVFYQSGKTVGHVALYIGDGEVIHASNEKDGIKISKMNYRTPYCIRRIV